jgi:DNA (cytosine-5)-methyltransferase 1
MLSVAEYFAGIGLMGLGLQASDWRVVFANDISSKKYAMYRDAFPDIAQHYQIADIFDLDVASIPQTTIATCSFPCTDLSLAGKQQGVVAGRHSSAFWGFINILEEQGNNAPEFLLIENVVGWLMSNKGQDFRVTIQALNRLGYACDVFTLDAIRFVPQSRPRVFVVAIKQGDHESNLDGVLARSQFLASPRLREAVHANADLNWTWLNIPEPPPTQTEGLFEIVEQIEEDDPRWWSKQEVKRHLEMMAPAHRAYVEQLSTDYRPVYRTMYRRMRSGQQRAEVRTDDISGCLRTASGGSARQMLVKVSAGQIQMRHMTSREYARLQGVPDHYPIKVSELEALTGFGDAVCVPLISWINQNILLQLLSSVSVYEISSD